MIDTLLAILQNLEPVLLVIATAWATVTATGINERRKRRYALEDRRSEERRQQHEQKRALLLEVLDHRSEYVRAQSHAPGAAAEGVGGCFRSFDVEHGCGDG